MFDPGAKKFFGERLHEARSSVRLGLVSPLQPDRSLIRYVIQKFCVDVWVSQRAERHRVFWDTDVTRLSLYLHLDSGSVARACLRFEALPSNAWLLKCGKHATGLCSDPACSAAGIPDSRDPRFVGLSTFSQRSQLGYARLPVSAAVLMGTFPPAWSSRRCSTALLAPAKLLQSIYVSFF
jgi:hypothetical protein